MSIQLLPAKPNHRYILTKAGREQKAIANKFENANKVYYKCVPKRWITEGWVVEVKERENA